MKCLLGAQRMREIDRYSIEEVRIPAAVLMEKAAMAVADVVWKQCGETDRILAVCGTGNNGGDAVAAARLLKEAGRDVTIYVAGNMEKASLEMKNQLDIAVRLKVPRVNQIRLEEYNVIIDGLFGIGLTRPIEGELKALVRELNHGSQKIFAVDIPSGISTDTGKIMGCAVQADETITFGYAKKGLVLYPGCEFAGRITVADIGFPKQALALVKPEAFYLESSDKKELLPKRQAYSNKSTYGKVLVIGGAKNMCGAALLSAKAAYRMGTGLVKIMTCEENRQIVQTVFPECLLTCYKDEPVLPEKKGTLLMEKKALEKLLEEEVAWADVIIAGPGLGTGPISVYLIDSLLSAAKKPVVLDADGLNIISERGWQDRLREHGQIIATPHLKELARLTMTHVASIQEDLEGTAKQTARQYQVILAAKDARTIVTDGKRVCMNLSGNHGMATGGSGDVLSGVIGGLLAQHMEPFMAAALGVYLHGCAGDRAAEKTNPYSLLAGDIIDGLIKEIG